MRQEKHAIRTVNNKTGFEHTKELFNLQKILNIYQLNILNPEIYMHLVYNETFPATFFQLFSKVSHPYLTRFSKLCYEIPKTNLTQCSNQIDILG